MRIYEAIYRYLQTVPAVTNLVGQRVYDLNAEQQRAPMYPAVVIEETDDQRYAQFGALPSATLRPVTISCAATVNPKAANDLADAIYAALMLQESAITAAAGELEVLAVNYTSRSNSYESDLETNEKVYVCSIDFEFIHAA